MVIRSYFAMESQVQLLQNPSHEEHSSTLVEYGDERLPKRLQTDELSSYKTETQLSQNVASAILTVGPIKNSDASAPILSAHQIVTSLHDQPDAKREALIQAIHRDPKDYNAYHSLANCLEDSERAQLLDGEFYTKKELYIKAIHIEPKDHNSYRSLANCLEDSERAQLLDGEFYTKKELYIKAIHIEPKDDNSYYNLADCLEDSERVALLNGKFYTKKELYIKCIELDPQYPGFYYYLARCLEDNATIHLVNGESYTKSSLYIKVIDLAPKDEYSYADLANCLQNNEKIQLLSGEIYARKELWLKVIQLNPNHENAYYNLANLLNNNETVRFLSGEVYTKKKLYCKNIELNPKDGRAYEAFWDYQNNETAQHSNGGIYTKKKFYCELIELMPKVAGGYESLARLLENDETIQLVNGEIYTKKKLYCKLIELMPEVGRIYLPLTRLLENDETIQLVNGKIYTKKDLYHKIIDLGSDKSMIDEARKGLKLAYTQEIEKNPNNIEGYFNLISIIQNDSVLLNNGERVDIEHLVQKALDLDPIHAFSARFAPSLFSLASCLHSKKIFPFEELRSQLTCEDGFNDGFNREWLLKQGVFSYLNGEDISTKALYQRALSFLSLTYLKSTGDKGVGDYLSYRTHTILQDGSKFTKLMAYVYAYQKHASNPILMKIGATLHPEQRILLNGKFYDKRACYEEIILNNERDLEKVSLKLAESLYPHEDLRKRELFHQTLEQVYQFPRDSLEAYIILARILSQYELRGLESKYLFIFSDYLKGDPHLYEEELILLIESRYENLDYLETNDEFYFTKKQEFLLKLLEYTPSCEEAYVALAVSFQDPLTIGETHYASKESLYLKAIDINPDYSLPYFRLGKELFNQKIESIQLLNGVILSCKQLFMRAIQLGTYEAKAYHLAALMMHDREGILLFDEKMILSKRDLFIRAFELDFTRVIDLKNFIYHIKKAK